MGTGIEWQQPLPALLAHHADAPASIIICGPPPQCFAHSEARTYIHTYTLYIHSLRCIHWREIACGVAMCPAHQKKKPRRVLRRTTDASDKAGRQVGPRVRTRAWKKGQPRRAPGACQCGRSKGARGSARDARRRTYAGGRAAARSARKGMVGTQTAREPARAVPPLPLAAQARYGTHGKTRPRREGSTGRAVMRVRAPGGRGAARSQGRRAAQPPPPLTQKAVQCRRGSQQQIEVRLRAITLILIHGC